jgi:hypothetical protein
MELLSGRKRLTRSKTIRIAALAALLFTPAEALRSVFASSSLRVAFLVIGDHVRRVRHRGRSSS